MKHFCFRTIILCGVYFILCSITSLGASFTLSQDVDVSKIDTITNHLSSINETGNFAAIKALKDAENSDRYYYLPFSSVGYLIYDSKLDIISEYSSEHFNSYIESTDIVYYAGALNYFTKIAENIIDIPTGRIIGTSEELATLTQQIDTHISKKARSTIHYADTRIAHYVNGAVPNYSYNENFNCGSTATAMMLMWYDNYVDDKYVPDNLESSNGVSLIDHLRLQYIEPDGEGSMPGDVYSGIVDFCSDQGVSHDSGMADYSADYAIGRIDTYQAPFVLNLQFHPTYSFHWVTCYGYNTSGGTVYPITNDGWGNTNVAINPAYCTHLVW